jgi:hypothetical protein
VTVAFALVYTTNCRHRPKFKLSSIVEGTITYSALNLISLGYFSVGVRYENL